VESDDGINWDAPDLRGRAKSEGLFIGLLWKIYCDPATHSPANGKGDVYFLSLGLEVILAATPFTLEPSAEDFSRFYREFADEQMSSGRVIRKNADARGLALSEFELTHYVICVGVNHCCKDLSTELTIAPGFELKKIHHGNIESCDTVMKLSLSKNEAFVIEAKKSCIVK
jgi:hypothetical protein